jgi:hypothetical protein
MDIQIETRTKSRENSHRAPCTTWRAVHPFTGKTIARRQVGHTRTPSELLAAYAEFLQQVKEMLATEKSPANQEPTYIG